MLSVHDLRKQGYKVRVTHARTHFRESLYSDEQLLSKGGYTSVAITTPDSTNVYGTAYCSDKDQYNKKLGVRIALGRALKELGLPTK